MATKKKGQPDSSKFEGNGISFKAKLIGTEEVPEARGDLLCQEAITKLKNAVKTSGQHKQKIFINVTLEGLKIIDAVSVASNQNKKKSGDTRNSKTSVDSEEAVKTDDMLVLHTHAVHRISFISRDTTDNRAFGYIIGSGDGNHTFFAIKTAAAAEQLVLTLRDLFQVVYEMKKKEVDEAKEKLESDTSKDDTVAENEKPSGEGSTSEGVQTQKKEAQAAEGDGIYHVPPNNAPVNGSLEEQQANLLDLEDQADSILKGIEQIKNLEFDSITSDGDKSPASPPMSPPVFKPGTADPWAVPATTNNSAGTGAANSSLSDLAGIQTGPFVNMPQQPFPGASFPGQMPGYNVAAVPGYNMTNTGLPVSRDPFGNDPFSAARFQHPGMRPVGFTPGMSAAPANPFGSAAFGQQPFQPGLVRPPMPGMLPGMFPAAAGNAAPNPFANTPAQDDPNLLKPIRNDQQGEDASQDQAEKAPKEDLFGDLLGIKKSTSAAKTPKDMFAQLSTQDKKSMNELKTTAEMPPKASFDDVADPFLNKGNVLEDTRRGLIPSEGEDPFDTSHISFLSQTSTALSSSSAPPLPLRLSPVQNQIAQESNLDILHISSPPTSISSSSLSSSSSSSLKQPSLLPPPPPSRVKNNPSPTVPHLSLPNKKEMDVSSSFILPSPDEPPPPLPQDFIKSPAAPPPPPRPSSSKSLSSMSSGSQHFPQNSQSLPPTGHSQSSSHQTSSTSSLSSSLPFPDPLPKPNTPSSKPVNNILKYDLTFNGEIDNDPFSVPLKSSSHNEDNRSKRNNKHNNNNFESKFDASHSPVKSNPSTKHNTLDSKSVMRDPSRKNDDSSLQNIDPFGLPLHLTPGFKAVARFGNDPFEDSFGASTNNTEQDLLAKWDPFPDTPSPFEKSTSKLSSDDPWVS